MYLSCTCVSVSDLARYACSHRLPPLLYVEAGFMAGGPFSPNTCSLHTPTTQDGPPRRAALSLLSSCGVPLPLPYRLSWALSQQIDHRVRGPAPS